MFADVFVDVCDAQELCASGFSIQYFMLLYACGVDLGVDDLAYVVWFLA